MTGTIRLSFPCKTVSATNGGTGNTRLAGIIASKRAAVHRRQALCAAATALRNRDAVGFPGFPNSVLPVIVTVCRVAPSNGLDPHDGLPPALKAIVDGIADALGLASDRDPRVTWRYDQRRGPYAVEVMIERRES